LSDRTNQQTLGGQKVQYPDCEYQGCSNESTRVFILRGCEKDKTYRCKQEEHEPYWKGPGGIEKIRAVDAAKDAINTEGENQE